jgi:hypothetical protein
MTSLISFYFFFKISMSDVDKGVAKLGDQWFGVRSLKKKTFGAEIVEGLGWHNKIVSECRFVCLQWRKCRIDQCSFGRSVFLYNFFEGTTFSRLNDFVSCDFTQTYWNKSLGYMHLTDCKVFNCTFSDSSLNMRSKNVAWKNCQWSNCRFDEMMVDSQSSFQNCDMKGLVVDSLIQTPVHQQLKLVWCGAKITTGLGPLAKTAQTIRQKFLQ